MFGEISDKGKQKLQSELEETHELFKSFINDNRPQVDLNKVATGEVWYGQQAIGHDLIDEVTTFDDYLLSKRSDTDIYHVSFVEKKSISEKLGFMAANIFEHSLSSLMTRERHFLNNR